MQEAEPGTPITGGAAILRNIQTHLNFTDQGEVGPGH